jgi:hypothetical protein
VTRDITKIWAGAAGHTTLGARRGLPSEGAQAERENSKSLDTMQKAKNWRTSCILTALI